MFVLSIYCCRFHDDVIKWKHFPRYWHLCWEFTDPRWIPRTKASDVELWCFLWSASELMIDYNMTVWHCGPCVTFWPCLCDISARLVWQFGPLVRNEGKRVSPYPHINHWRRLLEIPPIIGIKNNLTTIQQFHRIADSCYCVRIILTAFKHFDMKGSRYRVTSTASLDDGIVRQQFPVAKGCHVT